jgi:hypothetical protein
MLRRKHARLAALADFAQAQALTLRNPTWVSKDELQWGHAARSGGEAGWLDNTRFQYRPLTFQLWLWIARVLFEQPGPYHALWLLFGFGVAALLFAVLRRAGAAPRIAFAAGAAFVLNPYAAYVHGWVATLAELLWTACALGIAWFAFGARRSAPGIALAAFAFTGAALLAKETALAIPALLALAWALSRDARWRAALLGSLAPAAIYLALRLPVLLFAPRPGGAYAWSLANLPQRVAELYAWPFVPTVLEMTSLPLANPLRLAVVAAVALGLVAAVVSASRRLGALLFGGMALALGPAIVLATGYPQYGYAASALACACVAMAWPAMRAPARAIVLLALLLSTWHGANVQREMLRVGRLEAKFTPSLRPLIERPGEALALVPAVASDDWVYRRLTQSLPEAQREVRIEADGAGARIAADGTVLP